MGPRTDAKTATNKDLRGMNAGSPNRRSRRAVLVGLALCLAPVSLLPVSCKEQYVVGDHVLVEWEGNDYPAVIIEVEGPAKYRVHYDGYDSIWDESVNVTKIKGRVLGATIPPPPPAKVVRRGGAPVGSASAADGGTLSRYEKGQRIRVRWNGKVYPATIVEVLGDERYRVHYEGFGNEWDETIEVSRIKAPH